MKKKIALWLHGLANTLAPETAPLKVELNLPKNANITHVDRGNNLINLELKQWRCVRFIRPSALTTASDIEEARRYIAREIAKDLETCIYFEVSQAANEVDMRVDGTVFISKPS